MKVSSEIHATVANRSCGNNYPGRSPATRCLLISIDNGAAVIRKFITL